MSLANSSKRPGRTQTVGGFLARLPIMMDERVRRRLNQVHVLDAAVRRHLPTRLIEHCWAADYLDGTLVLAAASPVWATQLRFHTGALRQALSREAVPRVANIRVRVLPQALAAQPPLPRPSLSEAAAAGIAATAGNLTPSPLRDALLRLAKRPHP
jgi:hypothetical protein